MQGIVSFSKGPLTSISSMVIAILFGAPLSTQLFTSFWLIGVFGLLILLLGFCFTGIEFNTETGMYREYYRVLFLKFGAWKSYKEFKFVSVQGVMLSDVQGLPDFSEDIGAMHQIQSAKIMLLNEFHNKKLLIAYSKKPRKTKALINELVVKLSLPFVKYDPPVSQATQARKSRRLARK